VLKFMLGGPILVLARLFGPRILRLPGARRLATLPVSGPASGPTDEDLRLLVGDATHCSAYLQLLVKTVQLPGLLELASVASPTQLVLCEEDRVFPTPRGNRYFLDHLPRDTRVVRLPGLGHIPMLEAPETIAELISSFVDDHSSPQEAIS
jgi:pimeloyl-ACP methyl ester carboxylesterase